MSDIRQGLIDKFLVEMDRILDDNVDRITSHAESNPNELEDIPSSTQLEITALYEELIDNLAQSIVDDANEQLDEDSDFNYDESLITNAKLVGSYYLLQTMRSSFHRIHSMKSARQIINDVVKTLPEDSTIEEIDEAIEEAQQNAIIGAVVTGKKDLEGITVEEIGFSFYLLAKAEYLSRNVDYYIWRTQEDERVRPSHDSRKGEVRRWDDTDDIHVGEDYQCRCYPEAINNEDAELLLNQ